MAFIRYRKGRKGVYVYYYDTKQGCLVQIPRETTKAWDGLPEEEILALKRKWEEDHGLARNQITRHSLGADDKLKQLWDSYQKNRMRFKKRRGSTADAENNVFELYICRFFVQVHAKKDPTQWHALVPDFHNWLFEQPISDAHRRTILWALERFGAHLVFSRVMTYPYTIQTPTRDNNKETPLKVRIAPDEILKDVRAHSFKRSFKKHASLTRVSRINFKLAVLLGYFASLRPEELYALEKSDFSTGDKAVELSKTYAGLKAGGLGSKLVVKIDKSLKGTGVEAHVKSHHSYGYVNIWYPPAAKVIAEMLRDLPDGRLFPFSRGYLDKAWREIVYPIVASTAHDLRRASGLHLGRTLRIPLTLFQEHMRHAEVETSMLYMREPVIEEAQNAVVAQNFDEVV